jgi:hypothetical protein
MGDRHSLGNHPSLERKKVVSGLPGRFQNCHIQGTIWDRGPITCPTRAFIVNLTAVPSIFRIADHPGATRESKHIAVRADLLPLLISESSDRCAGAVDTC